MAMNNIEAIKDKTRRDKMRSIDKGARDVINAFDIGHLLNEENSLELVTIMARVYREGATDAIMALRTAGANI